MTKPLLHQHFRSVPWFAFAGCCGLLVDMSVLYLCQHGLGAYLGRMVSFVVAASFTWILNRRFTFRATAPPSFKEYRAYMRSMVFGCVLNYTAYVLTLHGMGASSYGPACGVMIGSLAGLAANYVLARRVIQGER
jgi:putative flippase GtrA